MAGHNGSQVCQEAISITQAVARFEMVIVTRNFIERESTYGKEVLMA